MRSNCKGKSSDKLKGRDRTASNIVLVVLSNLIVGIAGIASGFLVPKALGVYEYGYYKTFALYSSYVTCLLFGITNGILIFYAGSPKSKLPVERIRFISRSIIIFLSLIVLISTLIAAFLFKTNRENAIVIFAIGIYCLSFNLLNYFTIIAQSVLEFKKVILQNLFSSFFSLASSLLVYIFYKKTSGYISFVWYLSSVILSSVLLAIWMAVSYKELIFGKVCPFREGLSEITRLTKVGFVLMAADFASLILLHVDTQIANMFFDVTTFSIYSFAHSIVFLVINVIAGASVVLYPSLKSLKPDEAIGNFKKIIFVISALSSLLLPSFFIISAIVNGFLPDYTSSLSLLAILFPAIIPLAFVKICFFNYLQLCKKVYHCLVINISSLFISVLFTLLTYLVLKNPQFIAVSWVLSVIVYYSAYLFFMHRFFKVGVLRDILFVALEISIFYLLYFVIGINLQCFICSALSSIALFILFYLIPKKHL